MTDDELSPDETIFLATGLEGPILAFHYSDEPLIVDLLGRKLARIRPNADPDCSLFDLTEAGRKAVLRQLKPGPTRSAGRRAADALRLTHGNHRHP